ncbi:hypothetical protein Scep_013665 [Stephania cephalantha]|uniref:Uncharacterized protein n=1 Tax=Stephania cephalantha TaxID=152367 RepID=A0AAP0IZS1_9MAGN
MSFITLCIGGYTIALMNWQRIFTISKSPNDIFISYMHTTFHDLTNCHYEITQFVRSDSRHNAPPYIPNMVSCIRNITPRSEMTLSLRSKEGKSWMKSLRFSQVALDAGWPCH